MKNKYNANNSVCLKSLIGAHPIVVGRLFVIFGFCKPNDLHFVFNSSGKMPVDDELTTPMLQNDDDERPHRQRSYADDELDRQVTGCGASVCCNPSSGVHRFMALILMCLVGFGKCIWIKMAPSQQLQFIVRFQLPTSATTIRERYKTISKRTCICQPHNSHYCIQFIRGQMLFCVLSVDFYWIGESFDSEKNSYQNR